MVILVQDLVDASNYVEEALATIGPTVQYTDGDEYVYNIHNIYENDNLVGNIDYDSLVNTLPQDKINNLLTYTNLTILNWEDIKRGRRTPFVRRKGIVYKTTSSLLKLKLPSKNNLYAGVEVPIYTHYKTETIFEGYAKLIEKIEVDCNFNPFRRGTTNWLYDRWLVEFTESCYHRKGFRTHRYISYFHSVNSRLPSGINKSFFYKASSLDKLKDRKMAKDLFNGDIESI